jgi:hypothetical protein
MKQTRFMQAMFSAVENEDEELAAQVAGDIETAKNKGAVDTDEVTYVHLGDGKVLIIDNENSEATIAEAAKDQDETYDLTAVPDEELDKFLHPEDDGVTPDDDVETYERENFVDHRDPGYQDPESVEDIAEEGRAFSVYSDNTAVHRVFQDQEFCERVFSEVIDSEDTAVVGNLKVEKCADSDDSVVITDETTGDQAKVTIDGDELEVTELDQKELSMYSDDDDDDECECGDSYDPLYVVGIDPENHVIVDAPVYSEEEGQELIDKLEDAGVENLELFDCPFEARDHADSLLSAEGVESEDDVDEPEQAQFSDTEIYLTRYYSAYDDYEPEEVTDFMLKVFSEAEDLDPETQDQIEDAIGDGQQVENDTEIITPVDSKTAVVEDKENGEFTKAVLDGEDLDLTAISEEEADELTKDIKVEDSDEDDDDDDEEDDDDEKTYSWDEDSDEYYTDFMLKLYSEADDFDSETQDQIEEAIGDGKQIENDDEVITPVDSKTAVVEDKENGEFTKVTLDGEDLEAEAIDEDEADELTKDLELDEDEEEEDDDDEKTYSWDEDEYYTDFMLKLYSEAEDFDDETQDKIEEAIGDGKQIETDDEVITPVDAKTAVVEDKDNGEFTKVTLDGEDLEVTAIDEDEADDLTENIKVDSESDEEKEEKAYSRVEFGPALKYFADGGTLQAPQTQALPAPAQGQAPVQQAAPAQQPVDQQQAPVQDPNAQAQEEQPASVEEVEDKALVAVQSIQDAAAAAVQAIQEAKEAPAPDEQQELQEAQFSDRFFTDYEDVYDYEEISDVDSTLSNWLGQL